MSVIITDLGNDIKFDFGQDVYTLNKMSLRVKQDSNYVYLTNAAGFVQSADNKVIKLKASSVTSPVYASNDALVTGILDMVSSVSLGSSGSAGGGGNNTWSSKQGDFTATPTTGTKNITITGLSWTFDWENVSSIEKKDSSNDVVDLDIDNISVSGGVITLGNEDDFAAGDEVSVILIGPDKSYDEGTDSQLVTVINPNYAHVTSPEVLISEEDQDDAAITRVVVPYQEYKDGGLYAKLYAATADDTVTMTIWATNDEDADDSADTGWADITTAAIGGASLEASNETEEEHYMLTNIIALKIMIKIVYAYGGGGSADNSADVIIVKA